MRYPTRFQQRTLWNAVTGISLLVLGALLVGLIWLLGQIFGFLQPVLVPLIVAGIAAYLLDPVVRLLEGRGLSRLWSVVLVFIAILIATTLLVAAVLPGIQGARNSLKNLLNGAPPPASESTTLTPPPAEAERLATTLATSLHHLRRDRPDGPIAWLLTETNDEGERIPFVADDTPESLGFFWNTRAGRTLLKYQETITNWVTRGSTKVLGFLGLILGMIMVPVYLFFFLKDSAAIRTHWHDYVPLKASRFKTELVSTLQEINGYLVSFFRGQVLVAAIDGALVGIGLFLFGLPYALLIGIFMAILGIIPYIGAILCLIPTCIIAYLHAQASPQWGLSPWAYVGVVVAIFVLVQQINSLITAPKIVGESVGLHPLTVIFSMLFWSLVLGGFVGTLLAVPLTAAVKVLFRRFIWERKLRDGPDFGESTAPPAPRSWDSPPG
jgi:predicted PurR-regulated permease PerM